MIGGECRRLKVKCDLKFPCSHCVKRGLARYAMVVSISGPSTDHTVSVPVASCGKGCGASGSWRELRSVVKR